MAKPLLWMVLSGCLFLNACATMEIAPERNRSAGWTSSDPSTIPYGIRLKQFERGNRVVNPSFERGRVMADDGRKNFLLDGWEVVGTHVWWVDRKSGVKTAAKAPPDQRAVKISRTGTNELDPAEGILSDFIPVIPGNYEFTCAVRLRDVYGSGRRMTLPLEDTVLFRVLYFDADKKPLNAGAFDPVSKTLIDSSDKSYGFAHFWAIDDFAWGKVRARTYHYPFSEGDVPDRTRFVRLFLGLKGNGAMWIDDIAYRYSKWNFTPLERMKPYFGRPPALKDSLVPTPRHFQRLKDITYYAAGRPPSELPVILLPADAAPAEQHAAAVLQKKITAVLTRMGAARKSSGPAVRVVRADGSPDTLANAKLILSIGRNGFFQKVKPDLAWQAIRGKRQAYLIEPEERGGRHCVFLIGETPLSTFYAAATARQLFENDRFVYRSARVVDYPDFLERAYALGKWKNKTELETALDPIERLGLFKLNKAYVGYIPADRIWKRNAGTYLEGIAAAGRRCRQTGVMDLAVMANPYSHFPFEPPAETLSDSARTLWTHSSPESVERLKQFYKLALDAGAKAIMLAADDRVPHYGKNPQNYGLYAVEDQQRFHNLQNAQAHLINSLKQWIDADYPGTRLEFCPPWYANELVDRSAGKAAWYFKELVDRIPSDVAIAWTGPTIRSLSVDMADLHRFRSLIGRWPLFWDNTLYARSIESRNYGGYPAHYPGKVPLCNLFEPYDTYRPEQFFQYTHGRQIFANGEAFSEIYLIKYATFADYAWNTAAYDPELALWKVLCAAYGPAAAETLLHFNDAYYGLYRLCLRIAPAPLGSQQEKDGRRYLAGMTSALSRLSGQLPAQGMLLPELKKLKDLLKKRFEKRLVGDSR